MIETQEVIEFEGDATQDTLTYRFIDLSEAALTTAFESDVELGGKYFDWLATEQSDKKPINLYEFDMGNSDNVSIFAMPNANEFFIRFQSDFFEASVSIVYEIEKMTFQIARIVRFSGSPISAISWAEAMLATWDDLLLELMQSNGV